MPEQNPSSISDRPYCPIRNLCTICTETEYRTCPKYTEKSIYETSGACGLSCEDYHDFRDEDDLEDRVWIPEE